MDWDKLSLGERVITVARRLAGEHIRQELHEQDAEAARELEKKSDEMTQAARQIRQDLFRQPDESKEAA